MYQRNGDGDGDWRKRCTETEGWIYQETKRENERMKERKRERKKERKIRELEDKLKNHLLNILAKPKSHNLTWPVRVIRIFSGFTSLCIVWKVKKKKATGL